MYIYTPWRHLVSAKFRREEYKLLLQVVAPLSAIYWVEFLGRAYEVAYWPAF